MKTVLRIGLIALGLATAAQTAEAASLFICAASVFCGSDGSTTLSVNDFEGGFDVNGSQVQMGLNSPTTTSVSNFGSFVDSAAKNSFSGSWIANETIKPINQTFFFSFAIASIPNEVNYVHSYNYSQEGNVATLSGFLIAGILSATDLAAVGVVPTFGLPPGESGQVFFFDGGDSIDASIQTFSGVPEPSTWAMTVMGFAGLGWFARKRGHKLTSA